MEYKITIKKIFGHLHTVNKHRFKVFCLCCRVGIPVSGLFHDLSKYSPIEFWESVRYYNNDKFSPIKNCKEVNGYSNAWIHHKNSNRHHYEYWFDYSAKIPSPIIPFQYFLEMVCDSFAAGMTYQGKDWNQHYQLKYWSKVKDKSRMHPQMRDLLERVYKDVDKYGIKDVLKKDNLKKLYNEYTGEHPNKFSKRVKRKVR